MIVAVKLSIAELASLGVRAIELAVEHGADLDRLEAAVRAPIHERRKRLTARARLDRKNASRMAKRESMVRTGTCGDCGTEVVKVGRGPVPKRCPACAELYRSDYRRHHYRVRAEIEGRELRPNRAICCDCGAEVPTLTKGPVPKRCISCQQVWHRKRSRDAWRLKHWGNTEAPPS